MSELIYLQQTINFFEPLTENRMDQTPPILIDLIDETHPRLAGQKAMHTHLWSVLFDLPEMMNTYVVFDGATTPHLPEVLANSGMAHQCLFQGNARDKLGDCGPWVVKFEGDSGFAKGLITDAEVLSAYWPKAGFFLHSADDLPPHSPKKSP